MTATNTNNDETQNGWKWELLYFVCCQYKIALYQYPYTITIIPLEYAYHSLMLPIQLCIP